MKYFNECLLICEIIFISIHILRSSELYDENIPVHFISEGSYLIVAEGDQVLLPCKTNVLTEVVISWYKDDIRVAENLTFSFRLRSANREDAGFYHCVVKTAYGGIRSRKTRLEIGYLDPPSEVKVRSFIVVTLDQGVIIWPSSLQQERRKRPFQLERQNEQWKSTFNSVNETYKSTSSSYYLQAIPFPQATWTINNAPVPSTLNIFVSQLEQAIVLLNIDKEMDSKVIRARLINGYGSEVFTQTHVIKVNDPLVNMATYSLDLILPPKDASLTLRDDQPGTAIFECVFNARPPHALRVQWFRRTVDGKRELINPSNMILLETKKAANYNQTIYRFDTSGLNRTLIIDNILPNVIPSDYFQQNIQKGIYSEEYTCHAYLNDYNSNNIFDMSNFLFEDSQFTSSTLNYASSTSTTNLYKSISPISTTARLKLYLPPKIHYPRNLNVNTLINRLDNKLLIIESSASMNIQLPCELDCVGIPKAEIKWLRNGDFIDTHKQERYYIHLNKTLIIKNLKLTDAGVFQCYAYNEVGEDFLNIWLKVTSFAPRLCNPEENTENITVLKESTAVLTCLIHGAPTPEYKWYKETNENEWIPIHQLIQKYTNHNYSSIMNKNIFRQDVTLSDNKMNSMQRITNTCIPFGLNEMKIYHVDYKSIGRYKCEAVNYLGNESAFIYLNVYARTIPVHHLPNSITAFVNQSLSIMCSFYIDHYTLGEINWFHGRKESALNIQKNKTYNSKSMLRNKRNRQNDKVTTTYGHIHSVPKDPMITYFSRDISHKHKMPLGVKEYGSILHIDNVDISHQGYYVCEILSPGGNYTLRTELKVVSLPTTPTDLSITNNFETNYYDNNNNKNNMGVQLSWRQQRPTHQPNITQYAIFIYKLPEQNNLTKQTCEVIMDEEWELFSIIEINETVKILTDGRYTYTVNDSSIIFHSGSYCVSLSSVNFLGWSKKSIPVLYSVSHTRRATLPEINIKLYLINVTSTSFHIAWVTTLQVNKLSLSSVKEYQLYYWIENSDFMEVKRCSNVDRFIQRTELSNLKSSTKYHLKISACNEYGCGRFSNVLHVQTHPHELHKIPSRISITVYQTNEVKISFFSDYIYRDDHYIEQLEGYLIKLSCIDPPGCFDLQVYVPVECVTNSESFAKHKFRINHNNLSTSIHCKKLNQIKESAFIYSANVNNSNNQISIVLKSLSPYSLYELYIAYVYTHQIGPFSKPAEIFRTHEDIPSQIVNLMVNTDTRDGLIVDWDEPDKPNGKILQYILHYTEIKPIDSSINIYRPYDNLDEVYNNETFIQSNNISDDFQEYIGYWSEQSPQYHGIQQFSSTFTINTNSSNFIPAQTRENRKLAGYYSLNRTTRRVHIESLISKHIYQIRIFALNTAGLSSVTLQLGFTSVQPLSKHKYQHTEKNFVQWINLIHLNKHQEKTFKWLSNTYIQFISSPMIVKINAEDAEFSIEFELKQNDHVNHLPHPNKISPTISNFSQIMKLVEKCKWPIRIQQIPLNGYQAIQGNTQINSWSWRIIMAHKYKINSSLGLSGLKSTDFSTNKSAQVALSFKLLNLSSYNFYRIQVWQPIGLLFGNYDHVASKKLLHSNKSNWFTTGCKPPKTSPSPFYVNILYLDKMKITWQPLSPEEWNGIPGGYVITVQLVETKQALNLLTTHTNTNETVNIQSKCGLDYLQVFINDSTASSYIIEDMKLDGEYTVGIRAASVEIGNSSKLLLGPQAIIQPISISKQAKEVDETRYLTWMRKSKFIPYNLKVSREADWVVIKWKENLKVDCGILPKGYQLIFNKLWFNGNINETLHYNESVNFVKFISLNDTSLNRNKILQSSDSFYENILKLPLKIFFNLNEMCHFDGYLRFRLHNIGQLINKNTNEEAIVYVNLEAERIRHRLLLRKIIPLTKQKKARVLITWIPNIFNEKPIFPYKNLFTLQWTRLDPISYENLSLPSTRIISWPDVNNPILLNNEFATSQSNSRILSKQRYSEYLIAVDELLMDATYLFQLVETNFSQTIETEQNDKKKCSSVTKLLVYIKNVDNSQTVPKQRPITPKIKISKSGGVEELDENTICPTTKVHLAWPNYLRQLQSNQTTEYSTGFIYTSPVTNYTLQYAVVNNNCLNEDIHQKNVNNYACVTWKTYQVKPQFDDQNDFIVDELLPNKMYIFRLAAKTISGESPFSLPTNILITDPQRPCYIPLKLEAELISDVGTEITQHSDSITSRQSDVKTNEYCEYILVKWKVLENHLWNSQPGWYHITYKLWPSDNQNTNNQLFNLFIKHDESKIINSYLQVELRNLLPYRYYIISIEAINEYTLNSIHSTITQLSSSVLINSGYGCN
ncbi:Protein sidekick, partial [Schistosoma japonicum]